MYSSSQATLVHLLAAPLSLNLDHSDFQLGVKEILVYIYIVFSLKCMHTIKHAIWIMKTCPMHHTDLTILIIGYIIFKNVASCIVYLYILLYIYKCQCSCFLGQVLNSINQKITGASRKTQVINGMLGPRSSGHQLCKQKVIKPCVFYFNFSYYYIIWIDIYRKLY